MVNGEEKFYAPNRILLLGFTCDAPFNFQFNIEDMRRSLPGTK